MKKSLFFGVLTIGLMATDFSTLSTSQLIALKGTVAIEDRDDFRAELYSRIDSMTTEELAALEASARVGRGKNRVTPMQFSDIDTDNDGLISEDELDLARAEREEAAELDGRLLQNIDNETIFSDLDANDDGFIDATEFQIHQLSVATIGGMGQRRINRSVPMQFTDINTDEDDLISEDALAVPVQ